MYIYYCVNYVIITVIRHTREVNVHALLTEESYDMTIKIRFKLEDKFLTSKLYSLIKKLTRNEIVHENAKKYAFHVMFVFL